MLAMRTMQSPRRYWHYLILTLPAFLQLSLLGAAAQDSHEETKPDSIRVAIFADNRAGASFDKDVPVFEDFLASRISAAHMQILSREMILNSLKDFAAGNTSPEDTPGQKLDRLLSDSTSALRLAQNLGADYLMLATIASYGEENRTFTGDGVKTLNQLHTLRVSYRLAEAARGGEISGGTVTASKTLRQSEGLQVESSDIINQLLDEAAGKLAAAIQSKQSELAPVAMDSSRVKVNFQCTVTDFAKLPNVGLNEDNEVVLGEGYAQASLSDVTVEVNGITMGSAPGTLEVPSGLSRLRLTREGFRPFERTVNFYDGQTLTVALQMTDAGYARWKNVVATYTGLENNRKLTDAEVEVLRGYAQMLRQSGIKVDTKEGLKFYRGVYW